MGSVTEYPQLAAANTITIIFIMSILYNPCTALKIKIAS
jgi:hypothetical protein